MKAAAIIILLTLFVGLGGIVSCAAQPGSRTSDVPMVYRPYPPNPTPPPANPAPGPASSVPQPREPVPGTLSYLDFKNGFRDLKFGNPPTPDMHLVEDSGNLKFYRRTDDDLTIGGAQVHQINYGFYTRLWPFRNQLFADHARAGRRRLEIR